MAAPTGAALKALTARALKAGSKSEGMRMLLEAGVPVADVAKIFEVQYGFAYGVARRLAGGSAPAGATRRTPKAKTTTKAKAPARPAAKAKTTTKAPARTAAKATAKTTKTKRPAKA